MDSGRVYEDGSIQQDFLLVSLNAKHRCNATILVYGRFVFKPTSPQPLLMILDSIIHDLLFFLCCFTIQNFREAYHLVKEKSFSINILETLIIDPIIRI